MITALDGERLRHVMRPKVDGAVHLHELTRELGLSEFILFSSAASPLGSPGQANYAAANAFLDALAAVRRAEGLPALSLAFGFWERVTALTGHLTTAEGKRAGPLGMLPMPDELGLELIETARQAREPLLVPMLLDLAKLRERARSGLLPPIFSGLVRTPTPAAARTSTSPVRTPGTAPDSERDRNGGPIAADAVRAEIAMALGYDTSARLDVELSFLELGVDSLIALELRNRLRELTRLNLTTSLVYDHPTPSALVDHVEALLAETGESASSQTDAGRASANGDRARPAAGAGAGEPLPTLFRRAHQLGRLEDGIVTVEAASRRRPRFGLSHSEYEAPSVVPLSTGSEEPILFCFPSVIATAGPHEFARFARSFDNRRDVVAVPNPGYAAGEFLPGTIEAAAAAQAVAIARYANGRAVALVGFSTGGLLAYAAAAQCARAGIRPTAVVLIDTYTADTMSDLFVPVVDRMLESGRAHPEITDDTLTAMAAYLRLMEGWRPPEIVAPTLLVAATDATPGAAGAAGELGGGATWPHRDETIAVSADHLTILDDHADATARAIDEWLSTLAPPPEPRRLAKLLRQR